MLPYGETKRSPKPDPWARGGHREAGAWREYSRGLGATLRAAVAKGRWRQEGQRLGFGAKASGF